MKTQQTRSAVPWFLPLVVGGLVLASVGCGGSSGGGNDGGAGGTGGTVTPNLSYTFDSDKQGWTLSDYVDPSPTAYQNLGAADGGMAPALTWSSSDGNPSPGSLKLAVTFSGFKQYVDPEVNLAMPADLTNRIVKARVRLVSGTFPAGGVQLHLSSGASGANAYVYVSASFVNASSLTPGNWITIPLDTSTANPTDGRTFAPAQIVQVGVQLTTGDPFTTGAPPVFGDAVFELDTTQG